MGTFSTSLPSISVAIARCGDLKYGEVDGMDLPMRVRGMLQNLLGEANEEQVTAEAVWFGSVWFGSIRFG